LLIVAQFVGKERVKLCPALAFGRVVVYKGAVKDIFA